MKKSSLFLSLFNGVTGKWGAPALALCCYVMVACAGRQLPSEGTEPDQPRTPRGYSTAPFFPLDVGNSWRYSRRHLGQEHEHEVRIVSQEGPWFLDSEGERFRVDAEGLRAAERYLLRAPIRVGEEWASVVSLSVTEYYEITETGVSARVRAGQFHGCVRVMARVRVDPKVTLFKEDTYCPRVGLVRLRTWVDAPGKGRIPQGEMELISFQVAGVG